jgi:hypothetical protein
MRRKKYIITLSISLVSLSRTWNLLDLYSKKMREIERDRKTERKEREREIYKQTNRQTKL